MTSIKGRVLKMEVRRNPWKVAIFIIDFGNASGIGYWKDNLTWKDLSKPELESLVDKLESEGVTVHVLNLGCPGPNGETIDGWSLRWEMWEPGGIFYREPGQYETPLEKGWSKK